MLDREGKREKILEGKLREIRIKLKKQHEQEQLALRQAEKATDEIKDEPEVKVALSQSKFERGEMRFHTTGRCSLALSLMLSVLIETAEREFHEATAEEVQKRIKEQTKPDPDEVQVKSGHKKRSKAPKANTQEANGQNGEHLDQKNGPNGNDVQPSESSSAAPKPSQRSSFAEL